MSCRSVGKPKPTPTLITLRVKDSCPSGTWSLIIFKWTSIDCCSGLNSIIRSRNGIMKSVPSSAVAEPDSEILTAMSVLSDIMPESLESVMTAPESPSLKVYAASVNPTIMSSIVILF